MKKKIRMACFAFLLVFGLTGCEIEFMPKEKGISADTAETTEEVKGKEDDYTETMTATDGENASESTVDTTTEATGTTASEGTHDQTSDATEAQTDTTEGTTKSSATGRTDQTTEQVEPKTERYTERTTERVTERTTTGTTARTTEQTTERVTEKVTERATETPTSATTKQTEGTTEAPQRTTETPVTEHQHTWAKKQVVVDTIYHEAVTHEEPVYDDGWTEYIYEKQIKCSTCKQFFKDWDAFEAHDLQHSIGGYSYQKVLVKTIEHEPEIIDYYTVTDKAAYYEDVYGEVTYCTGCGATK